MYFSHVKLERNGPAGYKRVNAKFYSACHDILDDDDDNDDYFSILRTKTVLQFDLKAIFNLFEATKRRLCAINFSG